MTEGQPDPLRLRRRALSGQRPQWWPRPPGLSSTSWSRAIN